MQVPINRIGKGRDEKPGHFVAALVVFSLAITLGSGRSLAQSVNVITWHNDIGRTGQNTQETTLTTTLVGDPTIFGRKCSYPLLTDEWVFAQPLVLTNVKLQGQTQAKTVVYVVTMLDNIYAFDGVNVNADGSCIVLLGPTHLVVGNEVAAKTVDLRHGQRLFGNKVGILGTPVIEITGTSPNTTGTIYLVAESELQGQTITFYHRIWALDITSLSPVPNGNGIQICASGCGDLFSQGHIQRPGLLWLSASQTGDKNRVYAAFSMMDAGGNNPNGFILGFDARNLSTAPLSYETTPEPLAQRGGVWESGAGLAAGVDSSSGSMGIYFSTGDGDFDLDSSGSGGTNAADSFVKLTTSLQVPGGSYTSSNFVTPSDQIWRKCNDADFGSGGVMLLPDGTHPNYPYVALKGEKENYLWVINRHAPGGYNVGSCNSYCSQCGSSCNPCPPSAWNNQNVQSLVASPPSSQNQNRGTPAFWNGNSGTTVKGWVYYEGMYDTMKAYAVAPTCTPSIGGGVGPVLCNAAFTSANTLGYSATPSVSSGPAPQYQNGIVWAIDNDISTALLGLYAFDATNLNELWDSNKCQDPYGSPRDAPGRPTGFSVPTVANGNVYIGTQTDFDIYGQVAQRTCGAIQ